jgi:hypothetical protein
VKLLSIPAGEGGLPKAFRVPGVAIMRRRPSFKEDDHKNIIATTAVDQYPATTLPPARICSNAPQGIDLQYISALPMRRHLASLSRSGVFRARARTRSWRDRDVQQPKSFVWSPTRPANRLYVRRRSPIHASSIWSNCWRDRLHGTLFKPKRIAGSGTASRSKEVAS